MKVLTEPTFRSIDSNFPNYSQNINSLLWSNNPERRPREERNKKTSLFEISNKRKLGPVRHKSWREHQWDRINKGLHSTLFNNASGCIQLFSVLHCKKTGRMYSWCNSTNAVQTILHSGCEVVKGLFVKKTNGKKIKKSKNRDKKRNFMEHTVSARGFSFWILVLCNVPRINIVSKGIMNYSCRCKAGKFQHGTQKAGWMKCDWAETFETDIVFGAQTKRDGIFYMLLKI